MNPLSAKLLQENADHFVLAHADGKPFTVPKEGLSDSLANTIRSFSVQPQTADAGVSFDTGQSPSQSTDAGLPQIPATQPQPDFAAHIDQLSSQPSMHSKAAGDADEVKRAADFAASQARAGAVKAIGIVPEGTTPKIQPPPAAPVVPTPAAAPRGLGGGALPGMNDIRGGAEVRKGAAVLGGIAAAEQGRQEAERLGQAGRDMEAMQTEQQSREAKADAMTQDAMAKHQAAMDEVRNVATTVDPGRFWATRSTGGKIAGWIGMALGSLAPDGKNQAIAMIDKAIDRDLDAQKSEISARLQKGRQSVEASQSLVGMAHQNFGNVVARNAAAKAAAWGLVQNDLQKIAASNKAPAAAAATQDMLGRVQQNIGEEMAKAADTQRDNNRQDLIAQATIGAKGGGLSQASADAVTTVESYNENVQKNVDKLLGLVKTHGTYEKWNPGVEIQMKQLANDVATDVAKMKDPNSAAKADEVRLELSSIFQPGFFQREDSAIKGLEAYAANAEQRRQVAYKARGLTAPPLAADKVTPPHKGKNP